MLRSIGCTEIKVKRGGIEHTFAVPATEPPQFQKHREEGGRAPAGGAAGSVYAHSPRGPSTSELEKATIAYLKARNPEVLDSKVEAIFRARGWLIVWTPPYCPKVSPPNERTLNPTHQRSNFYVLLC